MSANVRRRQIRNLRRRRGQGMTEYIVLVGLIAILLIAAVTKFKSALENSYNKASDRINNDVAGKIEKSNS